VEQALPPELRARVRYERERSAELFTQDRCAIYGGFHLYVVNEA
jgi:S-adenosylmethionine-diacylglycerol 3-amino-3-carboxypropyl transferase